MSSESSSFYQPVSQIRCIFDLNPWYFSKAYKEYMTFLHDLNKSVVGKKTTDDVKCSDIVIEFIEMMDQLEKWIDEIPLESVEEQRFGNKAFRKFYDRLQRDSESLLFFLPEDVRPAFIEILPYFIDSFGNATRIDYGSGHEANFLIFLFLLRKLNVFGNEDDAALVLRIFQKYLRVCRHLQTTFKMEPAGSRGVHAIDDFQFAPFLFGSAQLIGHRGIVPESYLSPHFVEKNSHLSLFLDSVNFINQTKSGPFHEHSNQLWNISAVPNWNKVNEGMFKMYEGEVLKKFPVVQHFKFGSLFAFDRRDEIEELEKDGAPPPVKWSISFSYSSVQNPQSLLATNSVPSRQPAQHGMFSFKIADVGSNVSSANVAETGNLRSLHEQKYPEEKCPPPMADP